MILYACIPDGIPAFATSCVTSLAGAALLAVPFRRRVAALSRLSAVGGFLAFSGVRFFGGRFPRLAGDVL